MSGRFRRYLVQASVGIAIAVGLARAFLRRPHKDRGLVYLDVWQREVTYLDDEAVREVAMEGPDTGPRDDDPND